MQREEALVAELAKIGDPYALNVDLPTQCFLEGARAALLWAAESKLAPRPVSECLNLPTWH